MAGRTSIVSTNRVAPRPQAEQRHLGGEIHACHRSSRRSATTATRGEFNGSLVPARLRATNHTWVPSCGPVQLKGEVTVLHEIEPRRHESLAAHAN